MTMIEWRLTRPQPVELVPAAEATEVIEASHRELAALTARADETRTTADALVARAKREGADEKASTWAVVRLQRFIDTLRDEAERDAKTVVDAARRGARSSVDEPLVDDVLLQTPPVVQPIAPVATPAPQAPVAQPVAAPQPVAPVIELAIESMIAPVAPLVEQAPPVASAPTAPVSWTAPVSPVPPVANGNAPATVEPSVEAPVTTPTPVLAAPVVAAPVAPVMAAPIAAAPPVVSTPIASAPQKRGHQRGFPISAVLEVLAVILVLLFILLRLS